MLTELDKSYQMLRCMSSMVLWEPNLQVTWSRIFIGSFQTVMTKMMTYDRDGDGLIENSDFADQTYDAWPVSGPRFVACHRVGCSGQPQPPSVTRATPRECAFLPCGELNFGSAVIAQNDEFQRSFDSYYSRLLNLKAWPRDAVL